MRKPIRDELSLSESALGPLAEAITTSVLRAVAARGEFGKFLERDDSIVIWEPIIRAGGRLILGRGALENLVNRQQFDAQG